MIRYIQTGILLTVVLAASAHGDLVYTDSFEAARGCPSSYTPSLSNGQISDWETVYETDFPGPKTFKRVWNIRKASYLAIEFDTGDFQGAGSVSSVELPGAVGARLASISKCPGDFDVSASCTASFGISPGLVWSTDGRANTCQLEANETYWVNWTFTDGFDSGSDSCETETCRTELRVANPTFQE